MLVTDTTVQRNVWGQTRDVQRSDLWYVDFRGAVDGTNAALGDRPVAKILPQHAQAVTLPELNKIRVEQVRRDSIPYPMPSWDECLEPITVVFWLESTDSNPILVLLERWASLVRAGRGKRITDANVAGVSGDDFATALVLNSKYSIDFRFPISIYLMRGQNNSLVDSLPETFCRLNAHSVWFASVWLSGYKVSELDHKNAGLVTVTATFQPDFIQLESSQ